jgi:plastocyanin
MRSLRLTALAAAAVLAVAACTSANAPGWTYAPAPSPTPVVIPSTEPGSSAAASNSPSQSPGQAVIELSAQNIKFDKASLLAPADQTFQIKFTNNDAGVPHNVEIKDANGTSVFKGEIFSGVDSRLYTVPPLGTGDYQFVCSVHTNMVGTLVVGG